MREKSSSQVEISDLTPLSTLMGREHNCEPCRLWDPMLLVSMLEMMR